jgi:hypothetical protein
MPAPAPELSQARAGAFGVEPRLRNGLALKVGRSLVGPMMGFAAGLVPPGRGVSPHCLIVCRETALTAKTSISGVRVKQDSSSRTAQWE